MGVFNMWVWVIYRILASIFPHAPTGRGDRANYNASSRIGIGFGPTAGHLCFMVVCFVVVHIAGGVLEFASVPGGCFGRHTVRCARTVRKVRCFPPPGATGPRALNSAPPMLF